MVQGFRETFGKVGCFPCLLFYLKLYKLLQINDLQYFFEECFGDDYDLIGPKKVSN